MRELLVPVIKEGKRVYTSPSVMELRAICQKEQSTLWDESRRFSNPQKVYVDLSPKMCIRDSPFTAVYRQYWKIWIQSDSINIIY